MGIPHNSSQVAVGEGGILNICFMLLLSVAISFGNAVSLSVFLNSRHFKTPQGYLKASLATADLAVGVLVVPYSVYTEVRALPALQRLGLASVSLPPGLGEAAPREGFGPCFLVGPIFAGCTLVSIFTIFLLSVERSISVLRPLHKNAVVTKERTATLILLSWILCFLLAVAPLLLSTDTRLEYSPCSKMCNYVPGPATRRPLGESTLSVILLFPAFDVCVLGATAVLNLLTFNAVRRFCRTRKHLCSTTATRMPRGPAFSDLRAAKTILILTALLSGSVAPVAVLVAGNVLGFTWCGFSFYAFWILASSSSWNVLVYSARDRCFRLGARELFFGRRTTKGVRCTATTRSPTVGPHQESVGKCVEGRNPRTKKSCIPSVPRQVVLFLHSTTPAEHRCSTL